MKLVVAAIVLMSVLMSGCAAPKYGCKAPAGVGCKSITATYQSAVEQTSKEDGRAPQVAVNTNNANEANIRQPLPPGKVNEPLRRGARVLRVWYTPWVDARGDWHDQSYVHVVIDHGRWLLHENRKSIGTAKFRDLRSPNANDKPGRPETILSTPAMSREEARSIADDFIQGQESTPGAAP